MYTPILLLALVCGQADTKKTEPKLPSTPAVKAEVPTEYKEVKGILKLMDTVSNEATDIRFKAPRKEGGSFEPNLSEKDKARIEKLEKRRTAYEKQLKELLDDIGTDGILKLVRWDIQARLKRKGAEFMSDGDILLAINNGLPERHPVKLVVQSAVSSAMPKLGNLADFARLLSMPGGLNAPEKKEETDDEKSAKVLLEVALREIDRALLKKKE